MRPKWANVNESVLKVVDLVRLVDKSLRHEKKMARVTEAFPGADGVIRRPAVKLAPVFYELSVFSRKKGAVSVCARDTKTNKT